MAHTHSLTSNSALLAGVSPCSQEGASPAGRKTTGGSGARRYSSPCFTARGVERRISLPRASLGLSEGKGSLCEHKSELKSRQLLREKLRLSAPEVGQVSRPVTCAAGSGATEEAIFGQDDVRGFLREEPGNWWERTQSEDGTAIAKPGSLVFPKFVNDRADDIALHNPLKRLERLGCGWLAVLLEWDGVMVEDDPALERKSWAALAEEEGKPQPQGFLLRRADGMKNEQAIMEVFCWARDFRTVKRLAQRRDEIYEELQGGCYRLRPGSKEFIETLRKHNTPIAVVSTRPRRLLERAIEAVGMEGFFDAMVSSEDVYRGKPDPEMFQYAATCLKFIPERCIVVGTSNSTVEAARDAMMKVVAVSGKHPAYELGAADLVVSRLDNLSIVDLKNLADLDSIDISPPLEVEAEPEEERILPQTRVADF